LAHNHIQPVQRPLKTFIILQPQLWLHTF